MTDQVGQSGVCPHGVSLLQQCGKCEVGRSVRPSPVAGRRVDVTACEWRIGPEAK